MPESMNLMAGPARHMIFHASLMLLVGLLCGAPYGRAINRGAKPSTVAAWRVAHASLPMGAMLMIAVAAVQGSFKSSSAVAWTMTYAYVVSGYAFCISLPLAAVVGHRGLSSGGPASAKAVYVGNLVGAWGSMIGTLLLVYAAFISL